MFAINAHDTAARLAATARTLTGVGDLSEVKRHLQKIIDLLDATPSAYRDRVVGFPDTQGNIVEFVSPSAGLEVRFTNEQGTLKNSLLSSLSTASDVNEIARRYILYLSN